MQPAHMRNTPPRPAAPRCLEVGCGSGYVICSLALLLRDMGAATQLLATDINPRAAAATAETLAAHQACDSAGAFMFGRVFLSAG